MTYQTREVQDYASSFYIWETVSWVLQLIDENASSVLDGAEQVVVSFKQGTTRVDIKNPGLDVQNDQINIRLEQEQTALFNPGPVQLQVNIYYDNTERDTTVQAAIEALDNLYRRIMP